MTPWDLAKKNMKGNARNYGIYFLSMLISVVIYYTFVSLQYSKDIEAGMASSQNLRSVFMGSSIVLALFAAVFTGYSNAFFTRNRKKEIGLYALLGVRRKTIGRMLLYENLMLSALVLAAGIGIGTLLSKLFGMILVRLLGMGAATTVSFGLSLEAAANTIAVFALIVLATSLHSYRLIYKFALIELFRADKMGEPAPRVSAWTAIAAVLLIASGYMAALQEIHTTEQFARNMGIALVCILLGTWLLFRSAVPALLAAWRRNKSRYYRGTAMIGVSQLLFRARGHVRTFSMIALLSGITLGIFSIVYIQYYFAERSTAESRPFSYEHASVDPAFDDGVRSIVEADKEHPVAARLSVPVVELDAGLTNLREIPIHYYSYAEPGKSVSILSASAYNQASEALGRRETVRLAAGEAAAIRPMLDDQTFAEYEGRSLELRIGDGKETLPFVDLLEGRVLSWRFPDLFVVVDDGTWAELAQAVAPTVFEVYRVEGQEKAGATADGLSKLAAGRDDVRLTTYYAEYKRTQEESGLFLFIVGFLGLVFLAATGSMIYFKQMTEAHADKGRYDVLRKLGVGRRELRRTVAWQTLFVFALPLAVGTAHGYVIMKVFTAGLVGMNFTIPILLSMGAYIAVYFVYYAVCVFSNDRILNPA
ncbi:ABC transporter permease [Cohnella sp. JJ-181]|uniref:ABC transporter permease n=1 Tax=Cohnella rhizoplanae TaxID=2974897 RepID=UPI0022FF901C|nr:ABC transporter permease [Cohnella sp. JJ-181]CAI6083861.1 Bacitracin export permease protein BceB [Cohnella sp. JJ-181]